MDGRRIGENIGSGRGGGRSERQLATVTHTTTRRSRGHELTTADANRVAEQPWRSDSVQALGARVGKDVTATPFMVCPAPPPGPAELRDPAARLL